MLREMHTHEVETCCKRPNSAREYDKTYYFEKFKKISHFFLGSFQESLI